MSGNKSEEVPSYTKGENIRVFKLISGEEVMGRLVREDKKYYILSKPRAVAIGPGPNGQVSVTLIPLFASSQDGDITIYKSGIVAEPDKISLELEKGYIQQTTGIALA